MTSDERRELYNSMTPTERAKYRDNVKRELQDGMKKTGEVLSDSVHEKGIVGTFLEGAFKLGLYILLGGK